MTYPTFNNGDVLPASDLNAIGLWKVASGALSSTTTVFQNCFTSDFDSYRIIIESPTLSGNGTIYYRLYSGATPDSTNSYSYAFTGFSIGGAAANASFAGASAAPTGFSQNVIPNAVLGGVSIDIYAPNKAQRTFATHQAASYNGVFIGQQGMSIHDVQTAFNGIGFMTLAAETMGGFASIYGYRK
jgi:hypothetical protein